MYIIRNHFFFRCCVEKISFLSFVSCALFPRHPLCIYLCMYLSIYSIVYHPLFDHPPSPYICILYICIHETQNHFLRIENRIKPNLPPENHFVCVHCIQCIFCMFYIHILYLYIYTLNRNESISLYVYVSRAKYVSIYLFFCLLFVPILFPYCVRCVC